jgi:acetyltransferase
VESVKHARKFMSAARAAARNKPVIVVKAGRHAAGARAAASHTGALAGSEAVFDAAVRRAGMLRVDGLEALFDAAATLARVTAWRGKRLAILTNGGGAGVLAADVLDGSDPLLANLSPDTVSQLSALLPPMWSHGNPVDIVGDAPATRYADALRVLGAAPEVDGVLFMHAPTAIVPAPEIARECLPLVQGLGKPVLACWLGGEHVAEAQRIFETAGIACYETPERAAAAWRQLADYHAAQDALLQLPSSDAGPPQAEVDEAREVVAGALAAGREWLDAADATTVLRAYGIPTVATARVDTADAAVEAAARMGYPVALKIDSPQIVHKSDVGGVVLDLHNGDEVRNAAIRMRQRLARACPDAHVRGYTVQAMARRPGAHELIVGIAADPVFGPVVLFGEGGTAVELKADRAMALPPLTTDLARDLVARTRIAQLLAGYRGRPAARLPAIEATLVRIAQLACDLPEVAELDINPLLADADGVLALDARIRVRRADAAARPALRPYPAGLEQVIEAGGHALRVRPIRPDDGARLHAFYDGATPSDMRLRFFMARREVPHSELARYCQIDYEREMTFIALDGDTMVGEVRAVCDPDNLRAEFAMQVAGAWQNRTVGRQLLARMVAYLRSRGTAEVVGECLEENSAMASLARRLGFEVTPGSDGVLALRLRLRQA